MLCGGELVAVNGTVLPDERRPLGGRARAHPRAVAIGTFDGVHLGHRRVIGAARSRPVACRPSSHSTRIHGIALGYGVELLSTLERRLELMADPRRRRDARRRPFDHDLQQLEPEDFARDVLGAIGAEVVVAGETFRFGHRRRGDLELLRGLGFDARAVPFLEGVSSTEIRELLHEGDMAAAAGRARAAAGGRGHRRRRGRARRHARLPDREPLGRRASARSRLRHLRRRGARDAGRDLDRHESRTTEAWSGRSRRSCSTSRATSTVSGSWSSSGSASATSRCSRASRR